ncbi:LLM class flavin-dependent oxidoreductase [Microbacterium hatanonis]|uniref:LLM class flavin-dependent oxidoreductase n=1 Tax=Microbacterium hatanonis TaxID=404366 RepID=A0A5C8I1V1_9MICO|nr:LLM class flavin-dependent oxidoreductase [Microbacterium hatanonis]TXK12024.1 LLM class flavin-dependent oxidoreductase [Microbacterium hatanonis]
MPIELRSRLQVATAAIGDPATVVQRRAAAGGNWSVRHSTTPETVLRAAREQEELGYDGVLIAERSGWPDVYAQSSWVLANTTRLKTVSAHRIGRQSPTTTARLAQTIDLLSGGRLVHHFITGHNEVDQQRDGDFIGKEERYARAAEFLEIYVRELTSTEPFDFDGTYYRVRDALSGIGNASSPYAEISWAGSSPAALDVAARWADTFSIPATSLADTVDVTSRVRALAAAHGRTLRYWHNANHIVAETDETARDIAEGVVRELENREELLALDIGSPESVSRTRIYEQSLESDWVDGSLFLGLARVTGVESVPAFVGSPETVAEAMLAHYRNGVEIFGMDPTAYTQEELELKKELLRLLREGAARIDAETRAAVPV